MQEAFDKEVVAVIKDRLEAVANGTAEKEAKVSGIVTDEPVRNLKAVRTCCMSLRYTHVVHIIRACAWLGQCANLGFV